MIVSKKEKRKKISRYSIMFMIMIGIFSIITLKLVYIQIYKHEDYKVEANSVSTKFVSKKAARGEILDRNGNILASNKQTYTLEYTVTDESSKYFYKTMSSIFDILSEHGESIQDDFKLKIDENNQWYMDYENTSEDLVRNEDIRFKRDRGLNEVIEKKLGYDTTKRDLTDAEIEKVNDKLAKKTPEDLFYYLLKSYNMIELIDDDIDDKEKEEYSKLSGKQICKLILDKGYTYNDIRNYLIVKDEIKIKSLQGYRSITIKSNLDTNTAYIIMQKLNELPGINVSLEPTRYYPYNNLASSVIGYLSSISESNEEKYSLKGYDSSTDLIGVSGIESAFEDQLKGVTGGTTVKVNSLGRTIEELFKLESYPGNNVNLTIDKNIQYVAEQQLQEVMNDLKNEGYPNASRGAAVAVECKTGKILSLVSLPTYNPNDFATEDQLSDEEKKQYFNPNLDEWGSEYIKRNNLNKTIDDLFPLDSNGNREDIYDLYPRSFYNYATLGLIPPGSTFKPLTAIAGLESNVINAGTKINDTGVFNIHSDTLGSGFAPECSLYTNYHAGHGSIDVTKAIEVSCNFFFYETGYRLYSSANSKYEGLNALAKYAWKFGLGVDPNGDQKAGTGIEINENFGQVYNFDSYKKIMANMARYGVRDGVESGTLRGYNFVPLDYSNSEDDSEELQKYKKSLKDKINKKIEGVDPDNISTIGSSDTFAKKIIDDIKNIMNNSEVYKENIKKYESEKGITVDIDKEANKIANAIAQYVVYDMIQQMASPAQEIYASIGQGMNNFTPLQMVQYISTLVNGGTRYKLHLVDSITNPEGKVISQYNPEVLDNIELSKTNVDLVKQGMKKVNSEEEGTAAAVFAGFPIDTAGKTGTADFRTDQKELGREPYATYVSFAPYDDPEIAVAVVVYDGGHGGNIASVAKSIYEVYFNEKIKQINPNYEFNKFISEIPADNKKKF